MGLLFRKNIAYFDILYETKQHISQIKHVALFWKNPKYYPIEP